MNWSSPTGWRDNKKLPKKLVTQLQYSTLQTYFQYTGAQRQYMRTDGKGVCQSCHAVPPAGLNANGKTYPGEHGIGNQNATANECNSCHNHYTQAPQGSFAASCTNCHGQPPQAATAAPGYTGNEGTSAHVKHSGKGSNYAFTCQECHYSGAPPALHITTPGSYQDVFNTGHTTGILASKHGATPTYNVAARTCSTNYCHSNGAPRGLAFKMYTSPAWFGVAITTCDKCHEASPTTNVHASHVTTSDHLAFSCETCHSATVSGSTTIKDKTKHIDDNKEIVFNSASLPFVLSGSYDGSGSCATIYCHSDGTGTNFKTPNWTDPATGACGTSCHDTSTRTSGAHEAHLSLGKAYGPKLNQFQVPKEAACITCHLDHTTNHINGRYDTANQTTCSSSCHKNGIGSATWTSGRTGITCESCHAGALSVVNGFTAPDKGLSATKGHGMTISSTGVAMQYACTVCHNPDATHINPPVRDGRLVASLIGSLNTSCTFCHNDPAKVPTLSKQNLPSHVLDKNASPTASSCSSCHDLHGSSNKHMIRDVINGQAVSFKNTTGFVSTTPINGKYAGLCQVCHTLTRFYTNSAAETSHFTKDCLTCHKHSDNLLGQPAAAGFYAFKPTGGGCGGCHGYPPVQSLAGIAVAGNYSGARLENYSGGGGAHNVAGHIALTATPANGWSACVTCHYGTDTDPNHMSRNYSKPSNINVTVDPKYKFNAALQIKYSSNQVDPPLRNSTGTCSNVSCHFQPTPKWSTER
jgi:predicted CxxxxCH...CXXCH cytochrome family protein